MLHLTLFFVFLIVSTIGLLWLLKKNIFEGRWEYGIYFLLLFLPFYITVLSITYSATLSKPVLMVFQFMKEGVLLVGVASFILYQKSLFRFPFSLNLVDKLFLIFLGLAFVFVLLPVGEASFINRALYFKNMLIPGLFYFIGRNTVFSNRELYRVFNIIFAIAIAAFIVNLLEVLVDTHLQSITGYALYNYAINDMSPAGNYGLSWTFETQTMSKRFASFFSDPLELASSVLLGFTSGLIWYLTSKRAEGNLYLLVMIASFGSLLMASSRAAFAAFFVMIFFIALIFKLKRLILIGLSLVLIFVVIFLYFVPKDFYYFVLDTITFQNASSIGHVLEWIMAWESMIANPLGIGLAMSGNMSNVSEDLQVGGENQFLIFGVQLGFLGFFLYIFLLAAAVIYSLKVYYRTDNVMTARIAFVAATVKVGLLLPLFTANAEMYGYVSWTSWWMVGYAMNAYSNPKTKIEKTTNLS